MIERYLSEISWSDVGEDYRETEGGMRLAKYPGPWASGDEMMMLEDDVDIDEQSSVGGFSEPLGKGSDADRRKRRMGAIRANAEAFGGGSVNEAIMVSLKPVTQVNKKEESREEMWMRIAGITEVSDNEPSYQPDYGVGNLTIEDVEDLFPNLSKEDQGKIWEEHKDLNNAGELKAATLGL